MAVETKTNVFSTGGGGSVFENSVLTAYILTMILDGAVPGFDSCSITSIRFQAGTLGYRTDDMFINLISEQGTEHKLLGQIKHNVSITANNEIFKQVIKAFWEDYSNENLFNPNNDKLYLIKRSLNTKEANHVKPVLDWAKSKSNFAEYKKELETSDEKLSIFNIFVGVIREFSGYENTTEEDVWAFLRSVELLDYDFSSDTSVDKANCLSLIQLSRNNASTTSEDIWARIFYEVSQKNPKGASFSKKDLSTKFNFFDFQRNLHSYNSVKKIIDDGNALFGRIHNKIGDIHIKRDSIKEDILYKIKNHQVVIINGDAGSGKSAISKEVLRELTDATIIAFTADQFNRNRLSEVLSGIGISDSSISLFQNFTLFRHKIIYIDSLEKLLEDTALSFSELLSILEQQNDIKLVASCRGYALELIKFKHFDRLNSSATIEIPLLSDEELEYVKFQIPSLKPTIENMYLNELLRIPKYLDFTFRLIQKNNVDLSEVTEIELKYKLWDTIVKDSMIQNGTIHNRRGKTFVELAVRRAKEMTLFTHVDDLDAEAIMKLYNDGIISKANDEHYSPAHDILEDWALIRFIEAQKIKSESSNDFFLMIGEEPAIRRGFRLWLLHFMLEKKDLSYPFVGSVVFNDSIENHWRDEVIVGIINSDVLPQFIKDNQALLFEHNSQLMIRFVHLLRVTCKDSNQFPKGSGWNTILLSIHENLDILEDHYNLIIGLCMDWKLILYKDRSTLPSESVYVGKILLSFLNKYRSVYNSYARKDEVKEQIESSIKLLFQLTRVIQDELIELLKETMEAFSKPTDSNWESQSYYEKISEYALSGLYSGTLPEFFPDQIIELANYEWKKEVVTTNTFYDNPSDIERHYGLKESSITGEVPGPSFTFVSKLLKHHPIQALDFIIELMDYCSLHFVNSDFSSKGDCVELEFVFDDGTRIKKVGNQLLWQLYRGAQTVTPHLLQGILKALEKFMYLQGESNSSVGKENLDFCVDYLLRRSKSISTTAVVTSLIMAFPDLIDHHIISLVGHVELFQWDSTRWMKDKINPLYLRPFTIEGYVFLEENKEIDSWEHRRKYQRGLHGFVIDYQFNNGKLNQKIHQKIDELNMLKEGKDFYWKKVLTEIDIRKWKAVDNSPEEAGKVLMKVEYEGEVKERVIEFSKEEEKTTKNMSISDWTLKVYKEELKTPHYDSWKYCYEYYRGVEAGTEDVGIDLFSVPGTLASLGLDLFLVNLNEDEKIWCIDKIVTVCNEILTQTGKRYDFNNDRKISLLDRKPCLVSLPKLLILDINISNGDKFEIKSMIIHLLVKLAKENDRSVLVESVKKNLWKDLPMYGESLIKGIVRYAKLVKEKGTFIGGTHELSEHAVDTLFAGIVNEISIDIDPISYESHDHRILEVAIELLPLDLEIDFNGVLLMTLFESHLNALLEPKNRYNNYIMLGHHLKSVIAKYLVGSQPPKIIETFTKILSKLHEIEDSYSGKEGREFITSLLEEIMYVVDRNIDIEGEEEITKNFWSLWELLYREIEKNGSTEYMDLFLLKGNWENDAEDWKPLKAGRDFIISSIPKLSHFSINTMFELLSGIGFKTLMPNGLDWVVSKMRLENYNFSSLNFIRAEKLVEKTFREYTREIKEAPKRLNDFIWLLDVLIEKGSSRSYLIRENILLYKKVKP